MSRADNSAEWLKIRDQPHVKALIDRFEEALFAGKSPRIEEDVPADLPERVEVIEELAHLEIEYRSRHGFPASPAEYVERFPELRVDPGCLSRLRATFARHIPAVQAPPLFSAASKPPTDVLSNSE